MAKRITPESLGVDTEVKPAPSTEEKQTGKKKDKKESKSAAKAVVTEADVKAEARLKLSSEKEKAQAGGDNFGWLTNNGLVYVRYMSRILAKRKNALNVLLEDERITIPIPLEKYEENDKRVYYLTTSYQGIRLVYPKNTMVTMPKRIYLSAIKNAQDIKKVAAVRMLKGEADSGQAIAE